MAIGHFYRPHFAYRFGNIALNEQYFFSVLLEVTCVKAQVLFNKAGDKEITMIVTAMHIKGYRVVLNLRGFY